MVYMDGDGAQGGHGALEHQDSGFPSPDYEAMTRPATATSSANSGRFSPTLTGPLGSVMDTDDEEDDVDGDGYTHPGHKKQAWGGQASVSKPVRPVETKVKIAMSLYKVQQNIYLLDFQRVEGDAFGFMKLCAFIVTELKNLSAASRNAGAAQAAAQANANANAHDNHGRRGTQMPPHQPQYPPGVR
jgi:hypothetical protein